MSKIIRGSDGTFLEGTVANPGGRPKDNPEIKAIKTMQIERLIRFFDETGKLSKLKMRERIKDETLSSDEHMILTARIEAMNGNSKMLNIILDRMMGKPMQAVELTGKDGEKLIGDYESMSDEELEHVVHQLVKKRVE